MQIPKTEEEWIEAYHSAYVLAKYSVQEAAQYRKKLEGRLLTVHQQIMGMANAYACYVTKYASLMTV